MIDLLFENPIIIGVIVYFIWTLFKPAKHEKKPQMGRPVAPQPYGEEDNEKPYYAEVEQEREKKVLPTPSSTNNEATRPKRTLTRNLDNTVTIDYAQEKKRLEERRKKAEAALQAMKSGQTTVPTVSHTRSRQVAKPTQAQLRDAIIWSEILGKPRAKRKSIR